MFSGNTSLLLDAIEELITLSLNNVSFVFRDLKESRDLPDSKATQAPRWGMNMSSDVRISSHVWRKKCSETSSVSFLQGLAGPQGAIGGPGEKVSYHMISLTYRETFLELHRRQKGANTPNCIKVQETVSFICMSWEPAAVYSVVNAYHHIIMQTPPRLQHGTGPTQTGL